MTMRDGEDGSVPARDVNALLETSVATMSEQQRQKPTGSLASPQNPSPTGENTISSHHSFEAIRPRSSLDNPDWVSRGPLMHANSEPPPLRHQHTHQRNPSLTTPPEPPPDFNPPADFPQESPVHFIGTPTPSSPVSQSGFHSAPLAVIPSIAAALHPDDASGGHSSSRSALTGAEASSVQRPQRPEIRAIQRASSESVNRSFHSSASTSSHTGGSSASDGGEVLVQRRDELVSALLSEERDRDELPVDPDAAATVEVNIINPTPPTSTIGLTELTMEGRTEARMRPRSLSMTGRSGSDEAAHAWDSVWPAPSALRRTVPMEPGPSRFPMAPMSPYVTPSFSTSIVQAQTTRHPSTSPPVESFLDRPLSSNPRILTQTSTHWHTTLRPDDRASSPNSGSDMPQPSSPASAGPSRIRSIGFVPPGSPSPGSSRSSLSSSPPRSSTSSPSGIRLERPPSFTNQFPELTPPFISRRELLISPSRITRRLSETAIIRRPDASLRLEGLSGGRVSPPDTALSDMEVLQGDDGTLSPPLHPTLLRPVVPRRVRSAQDAYTNLRLPTRLDSPIGLTDYSSGDRSPSPREESGIILPSEDTLNDRSELIPGTAPVYDEDAIADDDDESDTDDASLVPTPLPTTPIPPPWEATMPAQLDIPESSASAAIVDEGDLLPTENTAIDMDVTFDDEGLNTLERIFLLSRSEYAFHRAYVARVLGDLLGDVDPCESVEYVLPLISAFSLDEDETVKEAFAADLHRILWYFFATCRLTLEDESDGEVALSPVASRQVATEKTGNGNSETMPLVDSLSPPIRMEVSPRQGRSESPSAETSRSSSSYDVSSSDSSQVTGLGLESADTLGSTPVTSLSGGGMMFEPTDVDKPEPEGPVERADPPVLSVNFFRPLLGTMLLSHNLQVANPTRDGIIKLIARLRGQTPVTVEMWGSTAHVEGHCRTFQSQGEPHSHTPPPFDEEARSMVEQELIHGIVLGMGTLSTDMPTSFFADSSVEILGEDGQTAKEDHEQLYRQQLLHEATLGRALSLSFIGAMSELYSQEEVVQYGFVDEIIRGLDGDVSTRAEAALAMGNVAKAAPAEQVERLLPVFSEFAGDDDPQVRQSASSSLAALCKRIEEHDRRREFAVEAMVGFMDSRNEHVQTAALETIGDVIYSFVEDPLGPPHQLLDIYCNDKDSCGDDCDWDILASFNFPGVCLTLGADRWPDLRGLYLRLVSRAGDRVLRTVAAFLHELANILHPDQVEEDVLPVFKRCLECSDDIRERIFEHIGVIISRSPQASGWACFTDLLSRWKDNTLGGWRAREQLALHIPSFLETFIRHTEVSAVLDMMRSALLDPFAAVRDAATYAVPRSYEILGRSLCSQDVLHEMLLDLALSSNYRQRLTFVRCLREFVRPPPNREAFERYFMPALIRMSQDVVDVRLGLAKAVGDLFVVGAFYGDEAVPVPIEVRRLATLLSDDDSADVREVITRIGAQRWQLEDAPTALAQEMEETENPKKLQDAVESALDPFSSVSRSAQDAIRGLHHRASIASPVGSNEPLADGENDVEGTIADDPFAASFGYAASVSSASASTGTRSPQL